MSKIDWEKMLEEIPYHFRPRSVHERSDGKCYATALAYISRQDVQTRLDAICGPGNWEVGFEVVDHEKMIVKCCLTLYERDDEGHPDFLYTYEEMGGPQEGQRDPGDRFKAACSDAFKRAATHPGIGRFLYYLDATPKECEAYRPRSNPNKLVFKRWVDEDVTGPTTIGDVEEAPSYDEPATAAPTAPPTPAAPATAALKAIPAGATASSEFPGGPFVCRDCGSDQTFVRDTSGKGTKPVHAAVWCRNKACGTQKYAGYSYPMTSVDKYNTMAAPAAPAEEDEELPF